MNTNNITNRVKTFEDAVSVLGSDNQSVIDYYAIADKTCANDILAYSKLRVIAEALNEGWLPKYDSEEFRYYPWFFLYTKEEYESLDEEQKKECSAVGRLGRYSYAYCCLACSYTGCSASYLDSGYNCRLAFKTRELARYCATQFADTLYDFLFA